jgi:hypothetical protein
MSNRIALRLEFPKAKIKTLLVPEKYIFREPDIDEDPYIIWVWNRRLNSGNTWYSKPKNLVTMNLRMLKKMHDCPEDMIGSSLFMSAVLIEELSHCATRSLRNHENWIHILEKLQEELHNE